MIITAAYASQIGLLTLAGDGEVLTELRFEKPGCADSPRTEPRAEKRLSVFSEAVRWLDLYFAGQDPGFRPRLDPRGSAFRRSVWEILLTIPYGQTMAYGEIADRIARERGIARMSAQAVGGAVGHNPIALIIPCHRVIGADGSLTGFGGGLDRKAWLLRHERAPMP